MTAILINNERDVQRYPNAADAFEALKAAPADKGYQVYIDPLTLMTGSAADAPEALERLYALAHVMLTGSEINPLVFGLQQTHPVTGEVVGEVSAATIMTQARIALDTL